MVQMRTIFLGLILVGAAVAGLAAQHQWQSGKWVTPVAAANGHPTEQRYAIETDQFILDVEEAQERGRRPLTVTIDASVTFALEDEIVYVRRGQDERALHLIDRRPKLKIYTAAGAGHYVKSVGAGGLSVTLEDGSVWDLDPTAQDRTAHWEPLAGIIVTFEGDQSENGFNYFLNNTDDDEGALAKLQSRP